MYYIKYYININYVNNIAMYVFFVMHLPEDGRMSG
jgi:hypothetical protein